MMSGMHVVLVLLIIGTAYYFYKSGNASKEIVKRNVERDLPDDMKK